MSRKPPQPEDEPLSPKARQLKRRIASGAYRIDYDKLAERLAEVLGAAATDEPAPRPAAPSCPANTAPVTDNDS